MANEWPGNGLQVFNDYTRARTAEDMAALDASSQFAVPPEKDWGSYVPDIIRSTPIGAGQKLGLMLAQDIYNGKIAPWRAFTDPLPAYGDREGAIERANKLAGYAVTGGMPMAPKGALGAFGGRGAVTADKEALAEAEHMMQLGWGPEAIWKKTGWFKGPEGHWKFEIPDQPADYHPGKMEANVRDATGESPYQQRQKPVQGYMAEVLDHPELYAAYPDLAHTNWTAKPPAQMHNKNAGGEWLGPNGGVVVNNEVSPRLDAGKSVTLHETQHAIQQAEGWPIGTNPAHEQSKWFEATIRPIEKEMMDIRNKNPAAWDAFMDVEITKANLKHKYGNNWFKDAPESEVMALMEKEGTVESLPGGQALFEADWNRRVALGTDPDRTAQRWAHQQYMQHPGEVEARAVERRRNLTPEEARARPPWIDYNFEMTGAGLKPVGEALWEFKGGKLTHGSAPTAAASAEGNEGLSYLINGKSEAGVIGAERGTVAPNGISSLTARSSGNGYEAHRLVYTKDGEIVGAMQITKTPSGPYTVANTYVAPEFRRTGIASALNKDAVNRFGELQRAEGPSPAGEAFVNSLKGGKLTHGGAASVEPPIIARRVGERSATDEVHALTRPGHVYRGMSADEYNATLGGGKGARSDGRDSFSVEGTNFAGDAASAESYANFGRVDPRVTGKDNYLVEVSGGPDITPRRDGYFEAKSEVPADRVTRVWRMSAKDGAVHMELVGKGGKLTQGGGAASAAPDDLWATIGKHDAALSGEHGRAIDSWVGGPHDSKDMGLTGGIMVPGRLERMSPDQWAEVSKPVQDTLRAHYGDTIPVYRAEGLSGEQSHGRQNKLFSYTTDRAAAEHHAGARRDMPIIPEAQIAAAEKQLAETGEATLGGRTFRLEDSARGGKYVNMYDRHGEHITDTPSLRAEIDSINADRAEHNAKNSEARAKVKEHNVPVDDVVWATDRFGQREVIVRKKQ